MGSSKDRRKARRKKERQDLQALGKAKEQALAAVEESFAAVDNPEEQEKVVEVVEETEKEPQPEKSKAHLMEVEVAMGAFGGSQSWDQLAQFRKTENKSDAVRQTEFEFRKMVDNVLNDPEFAMDQKSSLISALAEGFPSQVNATTEANKELDPGLADRILSKIGIKQVTKREAGADFKASDFADVPDTAKPSTWKLRLAEGRSGNFTVAQVARAITAMQPSGFRGQRVQLGTSKSSVASKISGAINKIKGATADQKKNLRERLAKVKSTGILIEKDLQGNWRWFGWVSNKWRDRDVGAHPQRGGEIISEIAHKDFVEWAWADSKKRMPQLWLWHIPGTAMKERTDWLDYADGYLLASGTLTESEAALLSKMADEYELGMSHTFFRLGYDDVTGVINKYRTFEASVLPRDQVANEWTEFATFSAEEAKEMFTEERRKFLIDAFGEEKVSKLEESTEEMAKELTEMGIEFKELAEAEDPKEQPKEVEKEIPSTIEVKADADELIEALGLKELSDQLQKREKTVDEALAEIGEKVEQLSKSDDEKIAEQMTPKAVKTSLHWLDRLSESEDTILDEEDEKDKELGKKKPGNEGSWLAEAHAIPASGDVPK